MSIASSLVQPLFDGPLDIIGDVHGEIDALRSLIQHLGYEEDGQHPDGRHLVFVGDLTDRGPDSIAVVQLVQRLVESGRAQCVLGNHDLNILLNHRKHENKWFYGDEFLDDNGSPVPQVLADETTRHQVLEFFHTLPIALERDDVRVIHACWDAEMIGVARESGDAISLYQGHREQINRGFAERTLDGIDKGLEHQNLNPVKLLTSGPEERADEPRCSGGKIRNEQRIKWWNDYRDVFCVFGHYSILDGQTRGNGWSFCIDYGIGRRWTERRNGKSCEFSYKLAALRFPEQLAVFDDGRIDKEVSLWLAYASTSFIAETTGGTFRIQVGVVNHQLDTFLRERGDEEWAFVTAHNPRSELLDDDANADLHEQLRSRVSQQGFKFYGGEGKGIDTNWPPEESLLILGIQRGEAIDLGKSFSQNAIVYGSLGKPAELVDCRTVLSPG